MPEAFKLKIEITWKYCKESLNPGRSGHEIWDS